MESIFFFIRNSHLPADKFALVTKFLETEDLIDKLKRGGRFSANFCKNKSHFPNPEKSISDLPASDPPSFSILRFAGEKRG